MKQRGESMKTIDTQGYTCPKPLIMLKEGLLEVDTGEKVTVITDNDTSLKNLLNYLSDQGASTEVSSEGKIHTIRTERPEDRQENSLENSDASDYCSSNDYVVCLKSDLMGSGDDELGKILVETLLDHLKLQEILPTHVLMYNSGVKLAMKGTPTCSSLSELEELGCRVVICGTCIDHFGLQYDIGVGMISNMVSITEILVNAGHVITP
jgi:selenium metabolism protein YedF